MCNATTGTTMVTMISTSILIVARTGTIAIVAVGALGSVVKRTLLGGNDRILSEHHLS